MTTEEIPLAIHITLNKSKFLLLTIFMHFFPKNENNINVLVLALSGIVLISFTRGSYDATFWILYENCGDNSTLF